MHSVSKNCKFALIFNFSGHSLAAILSHNQKKCGVFINPCLSNSRNRLGNMLTRPTSRNKLSIFESPLSLSRLSRQNNVSDLLTGNFEKNSIAPDMSFEILMIGIFSEIRNNETGYFSQFFKILEPHDCKPISEHL